MDKMKVNVGLYAEADPELVAFLKSKPASTRAEFTRMLMRLGFRDFRQSLHAPKKDESVNSESDTLAVEEESGDEGSFGLGNFLPE